MAAFEVFVRPWSGLWGPGKVLLMVNPLLHNLSEPCQKNLHHGVLACNLLVRAPPRRLLIASTLRVDR